MADAAVGLVDLPHEAAVSAPIVKHTLIDVAEEGPSLSIRIDKLRDCYGTSLLGAVVDVTTEASLMGHDDGGATPLKYCGTALDSNKRLAAQKLSKALGDGSGD